MSIINLECIDSTLHLSEKPLHFKWKKLLKTTNHLTKVVKAKQCPKWTDQVNFGIKDLICKSCGDESFP